MLRIETERLIMRNFRESDASGLLDYLLHPRVNCFLDERLNTLEEAVSDVKERKKDELQLAVCLKENDMIMGNLLPTRKNPIHIV